jgi:hypothetical protein
MLRTVKASKNARPVAVSSRIGGHDPSLFAGGLTGRYR